jgi:endoglucanase
MQVRQRGRRARRLIAAAAALITASGIMSVVALSAGPASAATGGTGTGFLSAKGSQLVDANGNNVRLTGLNWFGMETDNKTFHGLWSDQTWKSQLDHMASLGFNTIRVPYSNDVLKPGAEANSVNSYTNADLLGLSPMQILDKVVDYAGSKGMRILLDRHRPTSAGQTALWYTDAVPESKWISDWQLLAQRYKGNPTVIGADLHNEPHSSGTEPNSTGACWGCGDTKRDWRLAAERAGNAILQTNPDWLIVVEGVSCISGGDANVWDNIPDQPCGWWGGNLSGVAANPVRLSKQNKLVYSPHEYGISVYHQKWFDDAAFPANLPAIWDAQWGYIEKQNIAPLLFGEFGSTLQDPKDAVWLKELMKYMGTGVTGADFTYWSWNPDSGDTGGIVQDDWKTVQQTKYDILKPYLIAPVAGSIGGGGSGGGGGGTSPTASTSPSASISPSVSPSVSPSASKSPSTSPSASSGGGGGTGTCSAVVKITNSWAAGFQASVTVKNTGATAISPWTATFTVASGTTITSAWGATVSISGTTATATAPTWATSLAAGASAEIGFVANGSASPAPSGVKLNGATCA